MLLDHPCNATKTPWNILETLKTPLKSPGTPQCRFWNPVNLLEIHWNTWKPVTHWKLQASLKPLETLWYASETPLESFWNWNSLEHTWSALKILWILLLRPRNPWNDLIKLPETPRAPLKCLEASLESPGTSRNPLEWPWNPLEPCLEHSCTTPRSTQVSWYCFLCDFHINSRSFSENPLGSSLEVPVWFALEVSLWIPRRSFFLEIPPGVSSWVRLENKGRTFSNSFWISLRYLLKFF